LWPCDKLELGVPSLWPLDSFRLIIILNLLVK
jgi:hypothetical protein